LYYLILFSYQNLTRLFLFSYRLGLFGFAASIEVAADNQHNRDAGAGNYGLLFCPSVQFDFSKFYSQVYMTRSSPSNGYTTSLPPSAAIRTISLSLANQPEDGTSTPTAYLPPPNPADSSLAPSSNLGAPLALYRALGSKPSSW
jgi:hypothetical protein